MGDHQKPYPPTQNAPKESSNPLLHYPEGSEEAQFNHLLPIFTRGDDRPRGIYLEPINWPPGTGTTAVSKPTKTKKGKLINMKQSKKQGHQSLPEPSLLPKEFKKPLEDEAHVQTPTTPPQENSPPFKKVRYYNEGPKRIAFINFNEDYSDPPIVVATNTKHTVEADEDYPDPSVLAATSTKHTVEAGEGSSLLEPSTSRVAGQMIQGVTGGQKLLPEPAYTESKSKTGSSLPGPSTKPVFNKPKSQGGINLDEELHDAQPDGNEDKEMQSNSDDSKGDYQREGEKGESSKQGAIASVVKLRVRYTAEQESWLLGYITEHPVKGDRSDWPACSTAFFEKYKQNRKPLALCQKWKELDHDLNMAKLCKGLDKNPKVKGKGVDVDVDVEESKGDEDGHVKEEELNEPEKAKGKQNSDEADENPHKRLLERSRKHYTKEEKDWLLSYVNKDSGSKIDWNAVALEYTRHFRYIRPERMLANKWKSLLVNGNASSAKN